MSDDDASSDLDLRFEHLDTEMAGALTYLINEHSFMQVIVTQILTLLPDPSKWTLTISGDMTKTVDALEEREEDFSYTTDRGAGVVGARTITRADGESDLVISAEAFFFTNLEQPTVEETVSNALASAAHLALHEAGHALLHARGEDAPTYEGVKLPDLSAATWRNYISWHMDDFRIEQLTTSSAPSPLLQEDHLGDALAHLRSELNAVKAQIPLDIGEGARRSLTAANGVIRVLAYLAAELGQEDGVARQPNLAPDGWDEYVGRFWDRWSGFFHQLKPVDEMMPLSELAETLASLCSLTVEWLRFIGVDWTATAEGDFCYWTKDTY